MRKCSQVKARSSPSFPPVLYSEPFSNANYEGVFFRLRVIVGGRRERGFSLKMLWNSFIVAGNPPSSGYGYRMFVRPIQSPPGNPSPSGFLRLPGRKTPNTKISPHKNPGLLPPPPRTRINRAWKMRVKYYLLLLPCAIFNQNIDYFIFAYSTFIVICSIQLKQKPCVTKCSLIHNNDSN